MSTVHPQDPFIYTPKEPAPQAMRTMHSLLTLAAWVLYAYLWLPLVTVVAWLLGIRTSYIELYVRNNQVDRTMFLVILLLAIAATALLVGWAEYNRRRFSGPDRRSNPGNVQLPEVAESLGAPLELSDRVAGAKSMTLAMGEDARLSGIHRSTPFAL
ncbi:poly-beta-1,6-N-acetyl-D-glucosamine biosynthesis protein PgaD [Lysobacter sp. TY2-98]|uniref:poly-beta-1,6-N-acetyl-D-glucosamine biosynthesis protein PgaD n=1 Tax=Lysobacter sp. TY2-98 TaxID=2290922 RepID=UPI000E1FE8A6|nr:poly-beta-1,6-N-acetyl-D-glucosamine biosynthesis protein PgaD [Lysobacter sp. TY2-98]AXK72244.1 poly-beta-1,6-N-acetyl-D-glucosamine biosynthesis protein PgaD [Lysobacter sp. TY2-98]